MKKTIFKIRPVALYWAILDYAIGYLMLEHSHYFFALVFFLRATFSIYSFISGLIVPHEEDEDDDESEE